MISITPEANYHRETLLDGILHSDSKLDRIFLTFSIALSTGVAVDQLIVGDRNDQKDSFESMTCKDSLFRCYVVVIE